MTTKIGKLMNYGEVKKPNERTFLPSEGVWSPNLARRLRMVKQSPLWSHTTRITWSQEVTSQIENLMSPLVQCLYHQTWQGGDVCWQEATYGVTRLFDYADLWSHIKNLKHNISYTRLMTPKLGRWRDSTQETKRPLTI